jgi:hypothetical protein
MLDEITLVVSLMSDQTLQITFHSLYAHQPHHSG